MDRTWIFRLPHCWPVALTLNVDHWRRHGTSHGPQSMPRLMAIRCVRLRVWPPSSAHRVWLYCRGGFAAFADLHIDRR